MTRKCVVLSALLPTKRVLETNSDDFSLKNVLIPDSNLELYSLFVFLKRSNGVKRRAEIVVTQSHC